MIPDQNQRTSADVLADYEDPSLIFTRNPFEGASIRTSPVPSMQTSALPALVPAGSAPEPPVEAEQLPDWALPGTLAPLSNRTAAVEVSAPENEPLPVPQSRTVPVPVPISKTVPVVAPSAVPVPAVNSVPAVAANTVPVQALASDRTLPVDPSVFTSTVPRSVTASDREAGDVLRPHAERDTAERDSVVTLPRRGTMPVPSPEPGSVRESVPISPRRDPVEREPLSKEPASKESAPREITRETPRAAPSETPARLASSIGPMPSHREMLSEDLPDVSRDETLRKLLSSMRPSAASKVAGTSRGADAGIIKDQFLVESERLAELRRQNLLEGERLTAVMQAKREDTARLAELRTQLDLEIAQMESLRERATTEALRLEQLRRDCRLEDERLAEAQQRTRSEQQELQRISALVQAEQERAVEIRDRVVAESRRLKEVQDQFRVENERCVDAEARVRAEGMRLQGVQAQLEQETRRLGDLQRNETELTELLRELESKVLVQKHQLNTVVASAQEYALFASRRDEAEAEMETVTQLLDAKSADLARLTGELEQVKQELTAAKARQSQQDHALTVIDGALETLRLREDQARDLLERATAQAARLGDRVDASLKLLAEAEDRQRHLSAVCEAMETRSVSLTKNLARMGAEVGSELARVKAETDNELARVRAETGHEVARVRTELHVATAPVAALEPRASVPCASLAPREEPTEAELSAEAVRKRKLRDLAWTPWMAERDLPAGVH